MTRSLHRGTTLLLVAMFASLIGGLAPWFSTTSQAQSGTQVFLPLIAKSKSSSSPAPAPSTGGTGPRYVATNGNDGNPGTLDRPWRTISKGMASIGAGQTLYVRGGNYVEDVDISKPAAGTSSSRVVVQAYNGERPVIVGRLIVKGMQHWTIDGINVTWNDATGTPDEHMVKFTDGTGWVYRNAEVWGAKSYAAILITGAPSGYTLSGLFVHDTHPSNGYRQDHLIYVNASASGGGGVIERSLLINSPNGRAIKIGPPSGSSEAIGAVTVRYNTMYNNLGPSNIEMGYGASKNVIYRNIMQKVEARAANVETYNLSGSGNSVYDNIGWESAGVSVLNVAGLSVGGGNHHIDPLFANPAAYDFRPLNPAAKAYGRYAP